jgi:hypothetical protein
MMSTGSDDSIPSSSTPSSTHFPGAPAPRRTRRRAALAALVALLFGGSVSAAPPAVPFDELALVPRNIHASPMLLTLMGRMARFSPTFRAQCDRIARTPGLVVRMRYAGLRDDRPFNARTIVRRHEYGAMIAEVDLYVPLDPVEIVAHEFEHLVEQIQGTDLHGLARKRGSGVIEVRRNEFETRRAVDAGRRVLAEYGESARAPAAADDETGGV